MELYLLMFVNLFMGIVNLMFAFHSWTLGKSKFVDKVNFICAVIGIGMFIALLSK